MTSEPRTFIVETDAIYGGGVQLLRGDIATDDQLGEYVECLLREGAIRQLVGGTDDSPKNRASLL